MLTQPFPTKHPDLNLSPSSIHASNPTSIPAPIPTPPIEHPSQTSKSIIDLPATETPISPETTPRWLVEYGKESRSVDVTFVRAHEQEADVNSLRFSPDGKHLAASVGFCGKVSIYNVESAKKTWSALFFIERVYLRFSVLRESSLGQNKKLGLWYLCFAPDGRHLATTGSDDRVRVCLNSLSSLSSPSISTPFSALGNLRKASPQYIWNDWHSYP